MVNGSDDVVKAATGTLVEMNELSGRFKDAGIHCRIVGDDLTAGLGTAIPGSVEVWVIRSDAVRAAAIVSDMENQGGSGAPPRRADFPHPQSDRKPDRTEGPHHFPERHRPNP
jgi:hypothetical protein